MNVTHFLDQHGVVYGLYHHGETYDAQHMAQSLRTPGKMVAKTVMVRANHGAKHAVVVAPATKRIDLRKVSEVLGGIDVELATETEMLKQCPGCEFGVVPIFGSQFGMETMVDESVAKQKEIMFQGDTHEEAVRMRYDDFRALEHPRVASIVEA